MARLALGDPAPAFDLPDVDGSSHSAEDYAGKPLAVVFSCVHCPYVVAWEDRLNDVARDYDGRAGLVAVNSNAGYLGDSVDDMEARSREKSFAFPFLYHGTPDSDHQDPVGAEPYLRDALDALLEGGTPAVQDVPAVGCTIKWRR